MSLAWEVTDIDVAQVLVKHGVIRVHGDPKVKEAFDLIDCDEVEDALLHCCDMNDQVNAALSSIEDQLLEAGFISGEKRF